MPSTFCAADASTAADTAGAAHPTRAYFGAVHIHTSYSFDAYTNGSIATPANAYEWAQGKAIPGGAAGPELKIKTPLDFYAVSDHAEFMGVFRLMRDPKSPLSQLPIAKRVTSPDQNVALQAFAEILAAAGVTNDEVAFAGDDLNDVPLMLQSGLAIAVADAAAETRDHAHYVTEAPGGHGAVREAVELILKSQGKWEEALRRYLR